MDFSAPRDVVTNMTTKRTWEAFVRSDVYMGKGNNEDGEVREELVFYVVCRDEKGFQYAARRGYSTEEYRRERAEAWAERFCKATEAALAKGADPSKASNKWFRIQGVYGSAAWSEAEELRCEANELESEAGTQEADRFRKAVGLV